MRPTLLRTSFLEGGAEFVTVLLPPGKREFMHRCARMPTPLFDRNAHIGETVHLQDGWIDDLAHQIVHPLIVARRHAQQLAQAVDREDLDAPVHVGLELHQFVEGDGVFAGHRANDFGPDAAPSAGSLQHRGQFARKPVAKGRRFEKSFAGISKKSNRPVGTTLGSPSSSI